MEFFALIVVAVFVFSIWKNANLASDRHQEISDALVLLRNLIIEIKSGVPNQEGRDLNPNLFDIPPEAAAIVEEKNGVILDLKKEIENLNKQMKILRTSLNT